MNKLPYNTIRAKKPGSIGLIASIYFFTGVQFLLFIIAGFIYLEVSISSVVCQSVLFAASVWAFYKGVQRVRLKRPAAENFFKKVSSLEAFLETHYEGRHAELARELDACGSIAGQNRNEILYVNNSEEDIRGKFEAMNDVEWRSGRDRFNFTVRVPNVTEYDPNSMMHFLSSYYPSVEVPETLKEAFLSTENCRRNGADYIDFNTSSLDLWNVFVELLCANKKIKWRQNKDKFRIYNPATALDKGYFQLKSIELLQMIYAWGLLILSGLVGIHPAINGYAQASAVISALVIQLVVIHDKNTENTKKWVINLKVFLGFALLICLINSFAN